MNPNFEGLTATSSPKNDKETLKFIDAKKKEMKQSQYRARFDILATEIKNNLVNTTVSYGNKRYEANSSFDSMVFYNRMQDGRYDINVMPQRATNRDQNISGVPVTQEPIAFSKILVATSVLAAKVPDATVESDSKVYSKIAYDLWKKTWTDRKGNGTNTLSLVYQNSFTYGWAAWRVYPRRVQVERNGVPKIIFDNIYREALNPERTWLGVGFNNYDYFSQGEVYYEKDIPKDEFFRMFPDAEKNKSILDLVDITTESRDENNQRQFTHVTMGYYENVLANRYIVVCGKYVIYDGELPNDDNYGSVVVVRCFMKNMEDPYGIGLYEMMRGNTAIYTYISSLNAQQVEAEIFPLIFGAQVQNGTGMYKRGPNVINPKHPGTDIDVIRTTGNVSQGIAFADKQKMNIEDNTGVNNIVAGTAGEDTVGGTMIMKEAALNRLVVPRNSVIEGLELDSCMTHSWQKMTYTVDKVFMLADQDKVKEFVTQNPDYYVQSEPIVNELGEVKGMAVAASPNIRVNWDFNPDGSMIENVPTRKVAARQLFEKASEYGQTSPYVQFIIDPNSMLLPSQEIQKQTYMALYPLIDNSVTQVFATRMQDPEMSKSKLMSLEQMLEENKLDIFKYISKDTYDSIMQLQPSFSQMQMMQVNAQMPGGAHDPDSQEEGKEPGQNMTPDGADPMQPQATQEMPRPQSTLGASVDASLGRAKQYTS